MKYKFSNNIHKYIKDDTSIRKNYGELFEKIKTCLSVIEMADNLGKIPDKPPTKRHKLSNGKWALKLNENWRFVINPIDGSDPNSITNIIIESIEDYH